MYVCITEILCCTPKTNTILSINYTSIKKTSNDSVLKIFPYQKNTYFQKFLNTKNSKKDTKKDTTLFTKKDTTLFTKKDTLYFSF